MKSLQEDISDQLRLLTAIAKREHPRYVLALDDDDFWRVVDVIDDSIQPTEPTEDPDLAEAIRESLQLTAHVWRVKCV